MRRGALGVWFIGLAVVVWLAACTEYSRCGTQCVGDFLEDGDDESDTTSAQVVTCRAACQKFKDCDQEAGVKNSVYDDTYVANCQASCERAEIINTALATCIVAAPCAKLMGLPLVAVRG